MTNPTDDDQWWHVHHVYSASHHGHCPTPGTIAQTSTDVMPASMLADKLVGLGAMHNTGPQGCLIPGGAVRWTMQTLCSDGHRVSDMVIASPIR